MRNDNSRKSRWICFTTLLVFCLSTLVFSQDDSNLEAKRVVVKRLIEEGYNQQNFAVIDSLVAADYVEYTNGIRADSSSAIKKTIIWLKDRAPDFQLKPLNIIAEGNTVAIQWLYTGKNVKYDKDVMLHGIYIARFEGNLIVQGWQYFDNQQRYEQLGFKMEIP